MNQSSVASPDLLKALVWLNTKWRMVQPVNTSLIFLVIRVQKYEYSTTKAEGPANKG